MRITTRTALLGLTGLSLLAASACSSGVTNAGERISATQETRAEVVRDHQAEKALLRSAEQRLVRVDGAGVARPGLYQLPPEGELTLAKLYLVAGGDSSGEDGPLAKITRIVEGEEQSVEADCGLILCGSSEDIALLPGDDVLFASAHE